MKIYIASALHNRDEAHEFARALRAAGRAVVSTWHDSPTSTVGDEAALDRAGMAQVAKRCLDEVRECTEFVWLYGNAGERVGACVELGFALAQSFHITTHGMYARPPRYIYAAPVFGCEGEAPPSVFGALAYRLSQASVFEMLTGGAR